jgi:hypothetical protein
MRADRQRTVGVATFGLRINLVNANALATIASVVGLVPTSTLLQATKKRTTNSRWKKRQ